MLNSIKGFFLLSVCACFIGCDTAQTETPSYIVIKQPLVAIMIGKGEIEAAQAQRIVTPGNRAMTIDWLANENRQVKKGDVIVRFDSERLSLDTRQEELEMLIIEQDILQNNAEQQRTVNNVKSEQGFVSHEFDFTDRFAIDDIRVYSKLEIIETLQNRAFLEAKDDFLSWKKDSISKEGVTASAVLDVEKSGHEKKYNLYKESLSQLEVYAPFDGLLTYEKDKNGEKPSIGQTVFPGKPIAQIPNLDKLQARIYVLSRDAIALSEGLPVELTLDATPQTPLQGTVETVGSFPRSIERGSPITYIEVVVALNENNQLQLKPGNKITAKITNNLVTDALTVPLQSLGYDQSSSYVYVKKEQSWKKTTIQSGLKNQYFVEVVKGLNAGDTVSLTPNETP